MHGERFSVDVGLVVLVFGQYKENLTLGLCDEMVSRTQPSRQSSCWRGRARHLLREEFI